jgi:ATP-binding cassette subfamily C protein CydC
MRGELPMKTTKPNKQVILGLALAIIAELCMIGLLASANWFIVICALSGLSIYSAFSYMIPSALVRTFALGRIVFNYFQRLVTHRQSMKNLTGIRLTFFKRASALSEKQDLSSGDLVDRLLNDTDAASMKLIRVVEPVVVYFVSGIAVCVTLACIDLRLGALGLVMLAVAFVTYRFLKQSAKQANYALGTIRGDLRQQTIFAQDSWLDLQSLGADQAIRKRLEDNYKAGNRAIQMTQSQSSFRVLIFDAVMGACLIGIVAFAYYVAHVEVELLILIAVMLVGFNMTALNLPKSVDEVAKVGEAEERLELTDVKTTKDHSQTGFATFGNASLRVTDYQIPETAMVPAQRISFETGERGLVLLRGHSGTGKTTFLNWLDQQLPLGQHAYSKVDDYIFTGTVADNLFAVDSDLVAALKSVELDYLSPSTLVGVSGRELSSGEQTRLTVLRALLSDKPIVMLDEPLAGLDDATKQQVFTVITDYAQEHIVVMVMHDDGLTDSLTANAQIVEFAYKH